MLLPGTTRERRRAPAVLARRRALWTAIVVAAIAAPVPLLFAVGPPGRRPLLEVAAACGLLALSTLAVQLVLPARLPWPTAALGIDRILRLHRPLGFAVLVLVLAHVALIVGDDPGQLRLLDPLGAPNRARAAVVALVLLVALIGLSVARRRLGLRYGWWRLGHVALALGVLGLAAGHALAAGAHLRGGAQRGVLAALLVGAVAAVVHLRIMRPARRRGRRYHLEALRPERGGAVTLALRSDGHPGRAFSPGQFVWLTDGGGVASTLLEHPFSLSSSADSPDRPELTIKAAGAFTRGLGALSPGDRVLLDGPHGSFRPSRAGGGMVLIVGGIGITPAMSVLRTFADRGDRRRHVLLYGSREWDAVTFREELEALRTRLDLRVVHILERPPAGWRGEVGRFGPEVLTRHLPVARRAHQYLVCGPPPMVRVVAPALTRLGVPRDLTHVERFGIA